jgi:hypothetical protein
VTARAASEDPRSLAHWWSEQPDVLLVVDTDAVSDARTWAPPLHLALSKASARRSGGRARTAKSYLLGSAHPRPLPCTELEWNGRRVVLANAGALAPEPVDRSRDRNDVWHALARASAVLVSADGDRARGLALARRAAAFGVPDLLVWTSHENPELGNELSRAGHRVSAAVVGPLDAPRSGPGASAGAVEQLLEALVALPVRDRAKEAPLEMLVARSQPYGVNAGMLVAFGVVTRGTLGPGLPVQLGLANRTVQAEIESVPPARLETQSVVLRVPRDVTGGVRWVAHREATAERLRALSEQ